LSHYLEYAILLGAGAVARVVPVAWLPGLARFLALFWDLVLPFRKKTVLRNLEYAFPERPRAWRRKTARRCAEHFAGMALEFARLRRGGPEALRRRVAPEIEGIERYEAARAGGTSFIIVSGHLGNWEIATSYLAAFHGLRMAVLAKPLHNPLVEREVERVRRSRGYEVIVTRDFLRPIARVVREKRPLGFLADQDARKSGIFVPFFGKPASTFQGPALFAYRFNLPVLVTTCLRSKRDGRYHIRFLPPIHPDPKADRDAEIERLTRAHVDLLEAAIREAPEQYFWFHRRWKTQPKKR
jgi:KDO2-lipid IV(A) lauroyltransferase